MSLGRSATSKATRLLELLDSDPGLGQAYEVLMSSLALANGTVAPRTLLVTSARPEEGKSTVIVGLALCLARAGKRTLVVDADLRRPTVHRALGVDRSPGLGDVLDGKLELAEAAQIVDLAVGSHPPIGQLHIVASGSPCQSTAGAMQSPRLAAALRVAAEEHDVVLIDSPPVLSVSDALLLAHQVDGVLLVMRTAGATKHEVQQARDRLLRAGGNVLGVVMNRFDETVHGPSLMPYNAYYQPGGPRRFE